jgi:PAS domain S-box-containing protein
MSEPSFDPFIARLAIDCPDALICADRAGVIRFWNRAATRIFGFAEVEALGQRLDLIIPEGLRARHWEGFDRVMAGAPSRYGEGDLLSVPALHQDGRRISVDFTILPLREPAGGIVGIAAFLRDVTARFEEVRALRRELAQLKTGSSPPPS